MKHGTITAYTTHKCRCKKCRSKWAEYQRSYRKDNREIVRPYENSYRERVAASRDKNGKASLIKTHGLPGSYVSGCRCDDCTEANRLRQASYYATEEGKVAYKKAGRARLLECRRWVAEQKQGRSCVDCGGQFPPEAMDFDHVRGRKEASLSVMVRRRVSKEKMGAEIAKCDLVCSNCHRIRTAKRLREKYPMFDQ